MLTALPNTLTMIRIAAVPVLVALFYLGGNTAEWAAGIVFAVAAITDFFDGWLARAWRLQSAFGRMLDPVADKLLVATALMLLVAFRRVESLSVLPAIVILCRELLVSGLREFLAELRIGMPVSQLAKWKTTIQMVAITLLMVGDAAPGWPVAVVGEVGLWLAATLTVVTGYDYLRAGLRHIERSPEHGQ